MTEEDWTIVLQVFEASRSRRGDKGRDDRSSWKPALFRGHNITWRALPAEFGQLEQRVEAVLAIEPVGCVRGLLRCARGDERDGASRPDVRLHRGARPCLGGRRKRGQNSQALGRSRGGFSTKIHLKTDFGGLPIAFHLTGGQASDSRNFEMLLDIGPDITPRAAVGDKGYDAKANREAARRRGICPAIPYRLNIERQARLLSQSSLQRPRPYRAGRRQAQALQTHRTTMREDSENYAPSSLSLSLHLDQIRPHGLVLSLRN